MVSRAAAFILLGLICAGLAAAEVPMDCCLSVKQAKVHPKIIVSYYIQEAGNGCDKSATVFLTKGGKQLCLSHPRDFPWLQRILDMVDNRKAAPQ